MIHSCGTRPQISHGAFSFPMREKKELENKKQKQKHDSYQWSHAKIPTHQKTSRKSSENMNLKRGYLVNIK